MDSNYLKVNQHAWNQRTKVHFNSTFYDNASFVKGRNSLNEIELKLLGNVQGKSILHLQCHFGQDTISLNRLGAKATGIDLSDVAIAQAKVLAEQTHSDAQFICCDVYDLPQHLDAVFDIVFTSYGTIGWLPDMQKWSAVVDHFLKPGGLFIMAEFHPVLWMFDDRFQHIQHRYFNDGPINETETGTYAEKQVPLEFDTITWNHSLGEVVGNLLSRGLVIDALQEFDYSPYNCFQDMSEIEPGKFQIRHLDNKLPMVYAISAKKLQR
jgi:SAM-dependent methyltransferase